MQVKKEDIKEKIIGSACKEFLDHGYVDASLRVIAEKAGLTKGAIYSYYKNKDDLFCALTSSAISFIENEHQNNEPCNSDKNTLASYEATIQSFKRHAQFVLDNYKSFRLLLFCSAGSSLQEYRERIKQLYSQSFHKLFSNLSKTEPHDMYISEMFIHTLAATYISFLEELVMHEPDRNEVDPYAVQMAFFVRSGIEKVYSIRNR